MPGLPSNVGLGTVVARFGKTGLSVVDLDGVPDLTPYTNLIVTFTPSQATVQNRTAAPAPVWFTHEPTVARVNRDGYLIRPGTAVDGDGYPADPDGQLGVKLIATNDTDLAPSGWPYTVTFRLPNGSSPFPQITNLYVEQGATVDLVQYVTPVGSVVSSLSQSEAAQAAAVLASSAATSSATTASGYATSAATSATNAATSATASAGSATASAGSASAAAATATYLASLTGSDAGAVAAATTAANSATTAATAANTAATTATTAATAATTAAATATSTAASAVTTANTASTTANTANTNATAAGVAAAAVTVTANNTAAALTAAQLLPTVVVSGSTRTLAAADSASSLSFSAATCTLTLPLNATVAIPIGAIFTGVIASNPGAITVAPAVGVTVVKKSTTALGFSGQWSCWTLLKRGTDVWLLQHDGA